jgi:hypothetical protein
LKVASTAIARESRHAGAGDDRHHAGLRVEHPDAMVERVGHVDESVASDRHVVQAIEPRLGRSHRRGIRRKGIALARHVERSGDEFDHGLRAVARPATGRHRVARNAEEPVAAGVFDGVHPAGRIEGHGERFVDPLGGRCPGATGCRAREHRDLGHGPRHGRPSGEHGDAGDGDERGETKVVHRGASMADVKWT